MRSHVLFAVDEVHEEKDGASRCPFYEGGRNLLAGFLLILHFRKKEKAYKKEKQNVSNNENYKQ